MKKSAAPASFAISCIALILMNLTVSPRRACGEIYSWTDNDGVAHFTDDPGNIPKSKKGKEKIIETNDFSGDFEYAWFRPKAPPSECSVGTVRLAYQGKRIGLENIYVRRFVGPEARKTSGGMAEWWLDAVLDTEFALDPKVFPRVLISLVDGQGEPVSLYFEAEGRVVRSRGMTGQRGDLACWIGDPKGILMVYFFSGYTPEMTGMPNIGRGLEVTRLADKALICFLGCTPPESQVAGIRVRLDKPWEQDP